jgi:hypothetical protein
MLLPHVSLCSPKERSRIRAHIVAQDDCTAEHSKSLYRKVGLDELK